MIKNILLHPRGVFMHICMHSPQRQQKVICDAPPHASPSGHDGHGSSEFGNHCVAVVEPANSQFAGKGRHGAVLVEVCNSAFQLTPRRSRRDVHDNPQVGGVGGFELDCTPPQHLGSSKRPRSSFAVVAVPKCHYHPARSAVTNQDESGGQDRQIFQINDGNARAPRQELDAMELPPRKHFAFGGVVDDVLGCGPGSQWDPWGVR